MGKQNEYKSILLKFYNIYYIHFFVFKYIINYIPLYNADRLRVKKNSYAEVQQKYVNEISGRYEKIIAASSS